MLKSSTAPARAGLPSSRRLPRSRLQSVTGDDRLQIKHRGGCEGHRAARSSAVAGQAAGELLPLGRAARTRRRLCAAALLPPAAVSVPRAGLDPTARTRHVWPLTGTSTAICHFSPPFRVVVTRPKATGAATAVSRSEHPDGRVDSTTLGNDDGSPVTGSRNPQPHG